MKTPAARSAVPQAAEPEVEQPAAMPAWLRQRPEQAASPDREDPGMLNPKSLA